MGIIGYILGLYRDNGKENGNNYNGLYWGYIHSNNGEPNRTENGK